MRDTPLFPAFRARLAALGRRSFHSLRQSTLAQFQEQIRHLIPAQLLSQEEAGPNSRDRCFNLRFTFECFVWQMLKPRTACREVVRQVQALLRLQGQVPIDEDDSAYVQARQRLPKQKMFTVLRALGQAAAQRVTPTNVLQSRPVKVIDGSTAQLADTKKNQKCYPQPAGQKAGCGFPVMKFVVLFSLNTGAILEVMMGSLRAHELRLFRQLWSTLKKADIVLGDRGFGHYSTLAALPLKGVDVVARLHAMRKVDFRKAKRLSKNDGLFQWTKTKTQSPLFTAHQWKRLPAEITVRIIRFTADIRGFRSRRITLVTSLLDGQLYPAHELAHLYKRRWRLELCLRDLKTTLGMDQLRCQSPEMAQKELLAYLIAHNLIRCVMAEAACTHQTDLERLSFKGTVDGVRQYSVAIAQARSKRMRRQLWDDLLLNLVRDQVPERPDRREPRAVKRRPKPYPLLNQPRRKFVEISHRNRYWKGRPRNFRALN
jgi:hypothetical protein